MSEAQVKAHPLTVSAVIRLLRPKQWIKNAFIFVPITFARDLLTPAIALRAVATFACFCMASSAMYVFNDLVDAEADSMHPGKRTRPIPAGQVSAAQAIALSAFLGLAGLIGAFHISTQVGALIGLYVAVNVLYSLAIKRIVLLDVFAIAVGFVLRILSGAAISTVPASRWIILMAFFLALFLALGKRRNELTKLGAAATEHRTVFSSYTVKTIDQMLAILIGVIIVTFSIYAVSDYSVARFGTDALVFTVPFVLYGLFRYLHLINNGDNMGDPTELLFRDKPLLAAVGMWALACILIIYA